VGGAQDACQDFPLGIIGHVDIRSLYITRNLGNVGGGAYAPTVLCCPVLGKLMAARERIWAGKLFLPAP